MQRRRAGWGRLWSLCAAIVMSLSLAAVPATEAVKHGPGAMVAEADHLAYHAENGHSHDMPSGHYDAGDDDHVSAAVLSPPDDVDGPCFRQRLVANWEPAQSSLGGMVMKCRKVEAVRTIGLDISKNLFQLHGVDAEGQVVLKRQLRRVEVVRFFAELPPCLVGIEACAGAPA